MSIEEVGEGERRHKRFSVTGSNGSFVEFAFTPDGRLSCVHVFDGEAPSAKTVDMRMPDLAPNQLFPCELCTVCVGLMDRPAN